MGATYLDPGRAYADRCDQVTTSREDLRTVPWRGYFLQLAGQLTTHHGKISAGIHQGRQGMIIDSNRNFGRNDFTVLMARRRVWWGYMVGLGR